MSLEKLQMNIWQYPHVDQKKNSLEDIRAFLERMDNPDEKKRSFMWPGPMEKGSVCAYITSMLMAGDTTRGHLSRLI